MRTLWGCQHQTVCCQTTLVICTNQTSHSNILIIKKKSSPLTKKRSLLCSPSQLHIIHKQLTKREEICQNVFKVANRMEIIITIIITIQIICSGGFPVTRTSSAVSPFICRPRHSLIYNCNLFKVNFFLLKDSFPLIFKIIRITLILFSAIRPSRIPPTFTVHSFTGIRCLPFPKWKS